MYFHIQHMWLFCWLILFSLYPYSVFITLTTTMSSPSSCLVPLYWRNLQEHSWASTSAGAKRHSWESSYPRWVCVAQTFTGIHTCCSATNCSQIVISNVCECVICWQVVPDSDAHRAGLQEGDQVLSVNEVDFQDIEHSRVSQSSALNRDPYRF